MELLMSVCFSFIKIGAFSFGGGYSVLSLIQKEIIDDNGWISLEDFANIVGVAEMTPGPIAVNSSTFVGYNLFGPFGGILCTICVILIPFLLALLTSIYFTKFKNNAVFIHALNGIRPAVIGLIAASCYSIGTISFIDYLGILFFFIAFLMVCRWKINPIFTLIIIGCLSAATYGILLPSFSDFFPSLF